MRCYITSSDVQKYEINLNESVSAYPDKQCFILKEKAEKTKSPYDINKFFIECGKSCTNATYFYEDCINLLQENETKELLKIFKDNVLTKVNELSISDSITSDTIREAVSDQIIRNKICRRIIENTSVINNKFNFNNYIDLTGITTEQFVDKLSEVVNTFNMPVYGKFNTIIEESVYFLTREGVTYNEKYLVDQIYKNCVCMNPITEKDITQIKNAAETNYCLREDTTLVLPAGNNEILNLCNHFYYNTGRDVYDLLSTKVAVLKAGPIAIEKHFDNFIDMLIQIVLHSYSDTIVDSVIKTIIPGLYEDIEKIYGDDPQFRNILMAVDAHTKNSIEKCKDLIKNVEENTHRIYELSLALKNFDSQIISSLEFLYPKYNIECMQEKDTLTETDSLLSLDEFKLFKFDNILTRTFKIDRFLQKQFNKFKKAFKGKIAKFKSKIFEGTDISDILLTDGSIDYSVEEFQFDEADFNEIHSIATSVIKEVNENFLNNTNLVCYYTTETNAIDFRICSKSQVVSLSESEIENLNNRFNLNDNSNVSDIVLAASMVDDKYDLKIEATQFFSNKSNTKYFGEFLELCSIAQINAETVQEIYEAVSDRLDRSVDFVIDYKQLVEEYHPEVVDNTLVVFEALSLIQQITNSNIITEADNKNDDDWEDEDYDDDDDEDEDEKDDKKQDDKKQQPVNNNQQSQNNNNNENKDPQKEKENQQKEYQRGIKDFKLNDIKLYIMGLRKKMKDAGSQVQSKIKSMDAASERYKKVVEKMMVSDRREAIIKGSLIPSFHKCIAIAIAFAGGMIINAPITIIASFGAIAKSKELTKKERALMYDDIMIELRLVEKEIQLADSKDEINKMRALMRTKKELERQAARIKYNARIGKDIIPGGSYVNRDED